MSYDADVIDARDLHHVLCRAAILVNLSVNEDPNRLRGNRLRHLLHGAGRGSGAGQGLGERRGSDAGRESGACFLTTTGKPC